jgi:vancomycin resistance protein VanJ
MPRRDEAEETPSGGWLRSLVGFCVRAAWHALAWISAPVLVAALAVRLTVRDENEAVAMFYYATPWLVILAMATVCLIYWRARPRVRWTVLVIAAASMGMWIYKGFGLAPTPADSPSAFRVAYWNVARPEWRLDRILQEAPMFGADVFVFGEHRPKGPTPAKWQEAFAGKSVVPLARELLLIAPEPGKRIDGGSLGGVGGCQLVRLQLGGREVFLLMVDYVATLHTSRRPAFDRLFQIVDAYAEKPLIVIGDFNTPADSVHFDRLRTRLTSAFETAGRGYAATWPMPVPVLQLDHIWTNKHLRVIRCEHKTSLFSDHRAVVAEITFP